jgi:hypothetical protein
VRVLNSLVHYGLDITRLAFSGGQPLSPYIQTYSVDLFLSKDHSDEQHIINSELCAAAIIYAPPSVKLEDESKVKIAFDADSVLFSDESEQRYKKEVYVNETYFLGGIAKDKVLEAFGAHIFFDDQDYHLELASKVVPSGKVPYNSDSPLH